MDRKQLRGLLTVNQKNDYTWVASLPEVHIMWAEGYSEDEARENWLKEYDEPSLYPTFADIQRLRAEHPPIVTPKGPLKERPATVDFPYRGRLYRIVTNEGLPKRHIVLPNGTVLVVCRWVGRVPRALADVRRSPEPILPETIAAQLDGVLARKIPLLPGQTTHPMAVLDFEGQRYAVDRASNGLVEMPDGRLYRIQTTYADEEPVRIADIIPFDPDDSYMPYQLETFGKTPAIPVTPEYPGMARRPRDLRIHFIVQGERFVLSHEAYEQRKAMVYVPDHGFYRVRSYLQSSPVKLELSSLLPHGRYEDAAVALRLADAVDVEVYDD